MVFLLSILTQAITFYRWRLASVLAIILRATDMTMDGSFVIGAAVFARLVTLFHRSQPPSPHSPAARCAACSLRLSSAVDASIHYSPVY